MGADRPRFEKDPIFPHDGNNFSVVFYALRYSQLPGEIADPWRELIRMVGEKWGSKWTSFVDNNSELITRIFEALEARDPIIEINQKCGELYKAGRENEVERLIKESGFDEIDRKTAKKLNPLLRKAARKMNRLGINWRDVLR